MRLIPARLSAEARQHGTDHEISRSKRVLPAVVKELLHSLITFVLDQAYEPGFEDYYAPSPPRLKTLSADHFAQHDIAPDCGTAGSRSFQK